MSIYNVARTLYPAYVQFNHSDEANSVKSFKMNEINYNLHTNIMKLDDSKALVHFELFSVNDDDTANSLGMINNEISRRITEEEYHEIMSILLKTLLPN